MRYELAEDGDATLLTFTHTGPSGTNARDFIPGTHAHLAGTDLPIWSGRYAEVAPSYPSWA